MTAQEKLGRLRGTEARAGRFSGGEVVYESRISRTGASAVWEEFGQEPGERPGTMVTRNTDKAAQERRAERGGMALTSGLVGLLAAAGAVLFTGAAYIAGASGPGAFPHEREQTDLATAVYQGDVAATRRLIADGANPNAGKDASGLTLLRAAVSNAQMGPKQRAALVDTLLTARALPDLASGALRKTPLMDAAFRGDADVARLLLLRGARAARRDAAGQTPLIWLAKGRAGRNERHSGNALDVARALLEVVSQPACLPGDAAPFDKTDMLGAGRALLIAASNGDTELVTLILGRNKTGSALPPFYLARAADIATKRGDTMMARQIRHSAAAVRMTVSA